MTHLRALLALAEASEGGLLDAEPPAEAESDRLIARLTSEAQRPARPFEMRLAQARFRLAHIFASGAPAPVGKPLRGDLALAPWLLFHRDTKAAAWPGLVDTLLAATARSTRILRILVEAWLEDFSPSDRAFRELGTALLARLDDMADSRLDVWREAHAAMLLFDARRGPGRLFDAMLADPARGAALLARFGFNEPGRATCGFLRAAVAQALRRLPAGLAGPRAFDMLAAFSALAGLGEGWRFPDERSAVLAALLAPFAGDGPAPPEALRLAVRDLVLARTGDPRLAPDRWQGVPPETAGLVRLWNMRATLELFGDVLRRQAPESAPARAEFWTGLLDRGFVDDVWVVLGYAAYADARTKGRLGGAYASLIGGQAHQAVLLVRCGGIVFCDWSSEGGLRAWDAADRATVPLARANRRGVPLSYSRHELVRASLPFGGGHPAGEPLDTAVLSPAEWQGPLFELMRGQGTGMATVMTAPIGARTVPTLRRKSLVN